MIRLNKLTDYAVVVMTELAQAGPKIAAGPLSARTSIPQPTVAKLLKNLSHHGLIVAHRGRAGGYGLSRSPDEITVAEIIEAVEGPLAVAACVEGTADDCGFVKTCPMQGRWDKVNTVIRQALEGLSLSDMTEPLPPTYDFLADEPAARSGHEPLTTP